jgi:hypothetical protein
MNVFICLILAVNDFHANKISYLGIKPEQVLMKEGDNIKLDSSTRASGGHIFDDDEFGPVELLFYE